METAVELGKSGLESCIQLEETNLAWTATQRQRRGSVIGFPHLVLKFTAEEAQVKRWKNKQEVSFPHLQKNMVVIDTYDMV